MTTPACETRVAESKPAQYAKLDDRELLTLIGECQDRVAIAELYNRYRLPLGRFLQRKMCEAKLIEEVYNDVMLTVWNKASSFRGDSKVSTWLFGIAYRTRLTHTRKENRHNHSDTDVFYDNAALDNANDLEAQTSLGETVQAAMLDLSEQHRSVIELAYYHGYSTAEIAEIVDCPQNTVKTRLFHARKKLKATLEAEQSAELDNTDVASYAEQETVVSSRYAAL